MTKPQVLVKLTTFTAEDKKLIDNLLKAVGIVEYDIVNTKYYVAPMYINEETVRIYIAFGEKAAASAKFYSHSYTIIELPELSKLYNREENEHYRIEAFNTLGNCSEFIKLNNTQFVKEVPNLSREYLLQIGDYIKHNGLLGMTCITREGKKIYIYIDKPNQESKEYEQVSLNEILAASLARELLNLKDIILNRVQLGEKI